ncbi:cytochrome-c peroxidase [Formosa sp. A9]|uniref:cytochrome-c peroxidase n=1 Tax=Formosa sp. A9 TaxID=3442641 RepID=UPI003EC0579B
MIKQLIVLVLLFTALSCGTDDSEYTPINNPEIALDIPLNFPTPNAALFSNAPTKYGVVLGKKLFNDTRLSIDNSISCATCHMQNHAFTDQKKQAVGVEGRIGIRNTPPIQNLAFMNFYNWDGSKLQLEKQTIVPIITHEEMDSSMLDVISKLEQDPDYLELFKNTFGDDVITSERIFESIAQFEYTLISANSKYDRVVRDHTETFTESEARGYSIFQEKCASCHSTALFTDQSFRNVGFPVNQATNEAGRARVTGLQYDYMKFRVPSLRNIAYTGPYGSFGQFASLKAVLDYFDNGVIDSDNLDPIFKANNYRIPLTEQDKIDIIAFMHTLSDSSFINP